MKDLVGKRVKIKQSEAPYGFEGKEGVIVDYDIDNSIKWFLVKVGETNNNTPYESWFKAEHLEELGG